MPNGYDPRMSSPGQQQTTGRSPSGMSGAAQPMMPPGAMGQTMPYGPYGMMGPTMQYGPTGPNMPYGPMGPNMQYGPMEPSSQCGPMGSMMQPGTMGPMMQPGTMGPMMQPGMMGQTMPPWMPGPPMQHVMMGPTMPPTMAGPTMPPAFGPGPTVASPFGAFHCPVCGYSGPEWHPGPSPALGFAGPGYYPYAGGWGLGGLRRWGGTFSPQYTATGLPTDEEITEMVYDAIDADPLVPYDADIDIAVDAGVVTLSGTVINKRAKHAAGDDAWWVPGVVDVNNELELLPRRRARTAPPEEKEKTTR